MNKLIGAFLKALISLYPLFHELNSFLESMCIDSMMLISSILMRQNVSYNALAKILQFLSHFINLPTLPSIFKQQPRKGSVNIYERCHPTAGIKDLFIIDNTFVKRKVTRNVQET